MTQIWSKKAPFFSRQTIQRLCIVKQMRQNIIKLKTSLTGYEIMAPLQLDGDFKLMCWFWLLRMNFRRWFILSLRGKILSLKHLAPVYFVICTATILKIGWQIKILCAITVLNTRFSIEKIARIFAVHFKRKKSEYISKGTM